MRPNGASSGSGSAATAARDAEPCPRRQALDLAGQPARAEPLGDRRGLGQRARCAVAIARGRALPAPGASARSPPGRDARASPTRRSGRIPERRVVLALGPRELRLGDRQQRGLDRAALAPPRPPREPSRRAPWTRSSAARSSVVLAEIAGANRDLGLDREPGMRRRARSGSPSSLQNWIRSTPRSATARAAVEVSLADRELRPAARRAGRCAVARACRRGGRQLDRAVRRRRPSGRGQAQAARGAGSRWRR